ncbi:MAG TPA: hypothetical protein VGU46_12995 [Acidobacteriaceae bacterium]|nr:hypothetical protein [Acidobacteriaceae bacterium]
MAIHDLAQMELDSMTKGQAEPAAEGGGALAAVQELAGKLVDPSFLVAMGPQSALQVTPVTFQAVESEGRWKPPGILDPAQMIADPENNGKTIPDPAHPGSMSRVFESNSKLRGAVPYSFKDVKSAKFGKLKPQHAVLFTLTCSSGSQVVIDARWWSDGAEIYGGYAGMASAKGFGSIYNDMASITLQATPFGNHYPAQVLITWTGWVNPVGPTYKEFRGAFLISADGIHLDLDPNGEQPRYVDSWDRGNNPMKGGGNVDRNDNWASDTGFELKVDSTLQEILNMLELAETSMVMPTVAPSSLLIVPKG